MKSMTSVLAALGMMTLVGAEEPADWVDTRLGTARVFGSCVVGPSVPHGSAHPSPDSLWPVRRTEAAERRHGGGCPTSGWYPGDPVTGFSLLHAQGTGGTPSYGLFRVVYGRPSSMEILEARPYRFRARLVDLDQEVSCSATAHGAIFVHPGAEPTIDVKGKLACASASTNATLTCADGVMCGGGTYTGNWNPAPFDCWFYATTTTGCLRIAVSFKSVAQAKAWHDAELAGRSLVEIAAAARTAWNSKLATIELGDVDAATRRRFYSHFAHCFVQPRDRTDDFADFAAGVTMWDDHYTLWDTWKTLFPLMAVVDPAMVAGCVNSFAARYERSGRCTSCFTSGKEYQIGSGGDEADCVVADAFLKRVPGVDWPRLAPLMVSRLDGRTAHYRTHGWSANELHDGYCWRLFSGSATLAFASQDYAAALVLEGLAADGGRPEWAAAGAALKRRSASWRNVWNADETDPAGFRGFVCARNAAGEWLNADPRRGYDETFYEANGWESSFFVPHDIEGLIAVSGGREEFVRRLDFALGQGLVAFDNEPSFQVPWLFDEVGRRDRAVHWAQVMMSRFPADGCPGDDDAGAMASLYVFLTAGLYPVALTDTYALHAPMVPRLTIRAPLAERPLVIESSAWGTARSPLGPVTLDGVELDRPFITHAELLRGGTLVFHAAP